MSAFKDLTNQKFGKLTALSYKIETKNNRKRTKWTCVCDCGSIVPNVSTSNLTSLNTNSCRKCTSASKQNVKRDTPSEYRAWNNMKTRCLNTNRDTAKYYTKINICNEWINSFETFLNDMGKKPSPKHSLDRIDNSKGYSPDNCRWATHTEQANNRRSNVNITFNNITLNLQQWSQKTGINYSTLRTRLNSGWDISKALNTLTDARKGGNM